MTWDPSQYLRYDNERSQPTRDLIAALTDFHPGTIVDLGCGTGNSTALLRQRWPTAVLTGVDHSPEMLEQASLSGISATWQQADIAEWQPNEPADLIFSNASLHWLDDHEGLFPRLMSHLTDGGKLAVQMPNNFSQPSHTLIAEIASEPRWNHRLREVIRPSPVASVERYLELLEPLTTDIRVWTTTYFHVLRGEHPVAEWTGGATLRPVISVLGDNADDFINEYRKRLAVAYPQRSDGSTVLPFTRMFILAGC
ncbi:MAG: methyltransferase domain-containing protein [Ilumatobacteraceae bacterium]